MLMFVVFPLGMDNFEKLLEGAHFIVSLHYDDMFWCGYSGK